MDHYEIIIYWSAQDQAFIADVPELPGCMAHGATHEEALNNAKQAMALCLKQRVPKASLCRIHEDTGLCMLKVQPATMSYATPEQMLFT